MGRCISTFEGRQLLSCGIAEVPQKIQLAAAYLLTHLLSCLVGRKISADNGPKLA